MKRGKTQLTSEDAYLGALKRAREDFSRRDISEVLKALNSRELRLNFLGNRYRIEHPEGGVKFEDGEEEPPVVEIILILRYLALSNGRKPSGKWAPFSQFSGGIAYVRTFKEYAEERVLACFENSPEKFLEARKGLGGEPGNLGDASIVLKPFPLLPVQVVLWAGDEELPGEVKILFDENASNHLPCEELATLGELIAEGLCEGVE